MYVKKTMSCPLANCTSAVSCVHQPADNVS